MGEFAESIATAREAIKAGSRLRRMRLGQDAPEIESLRSNPEIRVALVPLSERDYQHGLQEAMNLPAPDNPAGIIYRDRWQQTVDLWNALREPNDVKKRVFDSPAEMIEELEANDVNYLGECYMRMMDESSPALEGLTNEQLEELKKAFVVMDWSVLSGKSWWHLKQCLFNLSPTQLRVSLPGSLSMERLIGRSDENEPISDADRS